MVESSQQVLRHVLESPYSDSQQVAGSSSSIEKQIFSKLQDAYDACMDEVKIKEIGSGPLLEVLRQIEEHFPAARPQSASKAMPMVYEQPQRSLRSSKNRLSKTITYLETIGVTALVSFSIGVGLLDRFSHVKTSLHLNKCV